MEKPFPLGREIPNVKLGFIEDGDVKSISSVEFFSGPQTLAVCIPGAFMPVCTAQHIPDFVNSTYQLRMAGYRKLVCIVPNDPFVTQAWSRLVDPEGHLIFLSDGNLELARAFEVSKSIKSLFVGERPQRYMFVTQHSHVHRFQVEPDILTLSRTRAVDALAVA